MANRDWGSLAGSNASWSAWTVGQLADQLEAQAGQAERSGAARRRDRLSVRGQIVTIDLQTRHARAGGMRDPRTGDPRGRGDLSGGQHRVYLAALAAIARGGG